MKSLHYPKKLKMKYLSFESSESILAAAGLAQPVVRISVESEPHGSPMFATLWQSDGSGLRIWSEMHDVAERIEVGVLRFSRLSEPISGAATVDLPPAFNSRVTAFKLVIEESDTKAESGIVLVAMNGDELIIVAGVKPYCLAICGLTRLPSLCEPEYPIEKYLRIPF